MLAVVTGTGGLGFEASLALAKAGARVVVAGRNASKGAQTLSAISVAVPHANVAFELVDLASLQSVRDLGARLRRNGEAVDILINNAGVMSPPQRETTAEGHELQFGVNYLAHFALTLELLPLLRRSNGSRIVNVTSLAQHYARLDLDDLQSEHAYRPGRAYCQSKLLQAMFTAEFQRRSERGGWGIASFAAHPGFAGTNLFQSAGTVGKFINTRVIVPFIGQSAAGGATPILFAATSPEAKAGRLYGPKGFMEMRGAPGECKFATAVHDIAASTALWSASEELANISVPCARAVSPAVSPF
jgi:NAD(P)-dependent dehydrogenase (short-subunit alcohol dehydrogenase family)